MNVKKYLSKLVNGCCVMSYDDMNDDMVFFAVTIDKKTLQDNIDLLAKEMHLEVENQAMAAVIRKNFRKNEKIGTNIKCGDQLSLDELRLDKNR